MNVFVFNAGSSSFKAAYFEGQGPADEVRDPDWSGEVRWAQGPSPGTLKWARADDGGSNTLAVDDHGAAAAALLHAAMETFGIAPDFIGHRIVHGLTESRCTLVDARLRTLIETAAELAPLHNRAALAGIDAAQAASPAVPQAADFDTAMTCATSSPRPCRHQRCGDGSRRRRHRRSRSPAASANIGATCANAARFPKAAEHRLFSARSRLRRTT